MGEVWAAMHTDMRREVALKLIYGDNPDLAVRLKREAQACGRLEHPNVVRIYDIGETDDGDPFLIMQLLTGETLADRLARRRRLPAMEALGIALDIARALRAAHAADIVHRDLKPANIYLHRGPDSEGEEVKVLDFGVSKILSVGDMAFTVTGALVGSPAYMSPEQARASKEIDPRADLWSLGVLLFEMLAGRRPFPSASPMGVIAEILAEPIPSLSDFVPGIDPRIEEAVNRCMTRDVEQRLQSAADFIEMLRPVYSGTELAVTGALRLSSALPEIANTKAMRLSSGVPDHAKAGALRLASSLPDLAELSPSGLKEPDLASVSSSGEDLPTRMIDREALLRDREAQQRSAPPRPSPVPSSESEPTQIDALPAWSRPAVPQPPPSHASSSPPLPPASPPQRRPTWQATPNPAIDTMMASSVLMLEREAAQAAAPPAPPLFPPRPQPNGPSGTDTLSTVPLFQIPRHPALDVAHTPLPLSWEPAPGRDRSRMALIVAVVVIVISLIVLLLLMLTADSAPASGTPEAASASAANLVAAPAPEPAAPPVAAPADTAPAPTASAAGAKALEKRTGLVNLTSTPISRVLLDGKPMGSTPVVGLSVPVGSHRVTFIGAGRDTKSITINVKADQRTTGNVRFD